FPSTAYRPPPGSTLPLLRLRLHRSPVPRPMPYVRSYPEYSPSRPTQARVPPSRRCCPARRCATPFSPHSLWHSPSRRAATTSWQNPHRPTPPSPSARQDHCLCQLLVPAEIRPYRSGLQKSPCPGNLCPCCVNPCALRVPGGIVQCGHRNNLSPNPA